MSTLALTMIVKDEESNLRRIIPKVAPYFDEIVIVDTGSKDASVTYLKGFQWKRGAKNHKVTLLQFPWVDDFAAARNAGLKATKSDWVFWIDADDDVEGLEALEQYLKEPFVYFVRYQYAPETIQWRERLFPREGAYWKGACHETVLGIENYPKARMEDVVVVHRKSIEDYKTDNARNLRILEKELENGEEQDPRTIYYAAQAARGLSDHAKAARYYTRYLEVGGWDEEKYDAWVNLSDSLRLMGKTQAALMAAYEATRIMPGRPDAFFQLQMTYFDLGLEEDREEYFNKSIEWSDVGFSKKMPDTIRVVNQNRLTWQPLLIHALALLHLGRAEEAYPLAQKALKMSNYDDLAMKDFQVVEDLYRGTMAVNGLLGFAEYLEKNDPSMLRLLVQTIPEELAIDSRVVALRNDHTDPKYWEDDEVTIFCGKSIEDWADPSVLRGIGGSEEAVIYLSRELVAKGKRVTVYNSCGAFAGTYKGVTYKPYYQFNPRDRFNVFVSWRSSAFFNLDFSAKKTYLWLHDKPTEQHLPPELLPKIDRVIFISKWQRDCLPYVPDEKAFISRNGLNMSDIVAADTTERFPHRLIWSSSYDRGIEHLLTRWGKIREAIPDAELVICYGWENFLKARSHDPHAMAWKEEVDILMQQEGIVHLGRIPQKKLAVEFARSSIWAYTCCFWETSCITAMRAQASGATPVTTDYAALGETVKYGTKVPGVVDFMKMDEKTADALVDAMIQYLKEPQTDEDQAKMRDWARSYYSWENVATDWITDFSIEPVREQDERTRTAIPA